MIVNLCEDSPDIDKFTEKYLDEFTLAFNGFIESLIKENDLKGPSLLLPITYRNAYVSPIYRELRNIFILKKISLDESIKEIIIDDVNIYKILLREDTFKGIKINLIKKRSLNINITKLKFFFFLFYHYLYSILYRSFSIKNIKGKKFTLLEIFLSRNSIFSSELIDHYYPHIKNVFTDEELRNIYFLPTFQEVNSPIELIKLSREMKKSAFNFFVPEARVSVRHYLEVFKIYDDCSRKVTHIPKFTSLNVVDILKEKLISSKYSRSNLFAFLRYYFFLNEENFNSNHKLILWNENHGPDKSICLAFSEKLDKPRIIGHQGFVPAKEKNAYVPLKFELDLKAFPREIYSLCWDYESYKDLDINYSAAPAFRFKELFEFNSKKEKKPQIFVGLPLNKYSFDKALKFLKDLYEDKSIILILRPHPLTRKEDYIHLEKKFSDAVIHKGEYIEEIASSQLFLTAGLTGLTYESIFLQTQSVIINSEFTKSNSNIFSELGYITFINTTDELKKVFHNPPTIDDEDLTKFKTFFTEPTNQNVRDFILD